VDSWSEIDEEVDPECLW